MNQVRHRFGLQQIDAAVQKGPPGKFTRLRQAGTELLTAIDHEVENGVAAVGADLDHVLASIGGRALQIPCQRRVHGTALVIDDAAVGHVSGPVS